MDGEEDADVCEETDRRPRLLNEENRDEADGTVLRKIGRDIYGRDGGSKTDESPRVEYYGGEEVECRLKK